jgi:hypothetical protein
MKLSEQVARALEPKEPWVRTVINPEWIVPEIEKLEAKAANWDLLEKLPDEHGIYRDSMRAHTHQNDWGVFVYEYGCGTMNVNDIVSADTPAAALKAYWENRPELEMPEVV